MECTLKNGVKLSIAFYLQLQLMFLKMYSVNHH